MANDKINIHYLKPLASTKNGLIQNFGSSSYPQFGLLFEKMTAKCEWIFLNFAEDETELSWKLEERSVLDFYVNSQSGNNRTTGNRLIGPIETGDGSKENPWINLNSVFAEKKIQCLIEHYCCIYIRIIVSGTIDYYIDGLGQFFDGRLMIEFVNNTSININWDIKKHPHNVEGLFYQIGDAIFKNVSIQYKMKNVITDSEAQVDLFLKPILNSHNSMFYNMNAEIDLYNSVRGTGADDHASCNVDFFYGCSNINILNSYFKINLESKSSQNNDNTDASVAHSRFTFLYNSSNSFVSNCRIYANSQSYAYDNYDDKDNSFTSSTAQAFGLINSTRCVLEYSIFKLTASASNNGKCKHSHIACVLGNSSGDAQHNGCSFSSSNIDDNGTNSWVTNYPYICNS